MHSDDGDNAGHDNDKDGQRDRGRWKPGVSGNPNGRPKKEPEKVEKLSFEEALLKLMNEPISLNQSGKMVQMPGYEAAALSFFKAMLDAKGVAKARMIELTLRLLQQGKLTVAEKPDTFSWTEEQEKLFAKIKRITGYEFERDDQDDGRASDGEEP